MVDFVQKENFLSFFQTSYNKIIIFLIIAYNKKICLSNSNNWITNILKGFKGNINKLSNHRLLFFFGSLARDSILFITHDHLRLKGDKN